MSTQHEPPRLCPICGNDVVLEATGGASQPAGAPRYLCAGALGCGMRWSGPGPAPGPAGPGAEAA